MKVVLDTNVILSAAFRTGVCSKVLEHCLISSEIEIVLSEHILREFMEHATGKFKAPRDTVDAVASQLRTLCTIVQPVPVPAEAFEDADDLPVLVRHGHRRRR